MEKPYFLPAKKINRPAISVSSGWFATITGESHGITNSTNWVHCRETFQGYGMEEILFSHSPNIGENIADFVNLFEKKLNHEKISYFAPTNWNRALWVKPAKFWLFKPMRKSLFTVLLRAGMRYNPAKDNFDEALYSVNYLSRTKRAVEFFMEGNTWYKGDYAGWYDQFRGKSAKELQTLLGKKPIPTKLLMEYIAHLLGTTQNELVAQVAKEPQDEEILRHALTMLNMDKKQLIEKMVRDRKSEKAIMEFGLSKLGKTKEEVLEDLRKNKSQFLSQIEPEEKPKRRRQLAR